MFVQIAIGTGLLLLSFIVASISFWGIEAFLHRIRFWLRKPPRLRRMVGFLMIALMWVLLQLTIGVWMWAVCLFALGLFDGIEPAVYFALVAYTTLGFGDILLPLEWRLLGGMMALNGLLNIGLVTALLVEFLRRARWEQNEDFSK
jgi:hypothetical protein